MDATSNQLPLEIEQNGFAVLPLVLGQPEIERLTRAISNPRNTDARRRRNAIYAIRNLLDVVPEVSQLASDAKILGIARSVLGPDATPVKGTLFDKTPDANWLVPWHQDLTICVNERIEQPGYGPWTIKAGVINVQPPVSVLDSMLAVRLHLDDCEERNGALRVLPATHTKGRLTAAQIAHLQQCVEAVTCTVQSGGAVLMKPLLLHASSPSLEPSHRRVIHLDFAAIQLARGLSWLRDHKHPNL